MSRLLDPQQGTKEPYLKLWRPDGIRVLLLEAGDWKDPISCELRNTTLSHNPQYHALSYAWGSSRATRPVIVNSVELDVTVNLECALRHLRRRDRLLPLWVDALVGPHGMT